MKKLILFLCLLANIAAAQVTNLPAGPVVTAYKHNPFQMFFEWPAGTTIPTPVTAEILTGGDFQKTSIVPTISVSGQTISFSMTATQVRQVVKNSHWRILFNGVRLLGNEFKTSSEATVPGSTAFVINLPSASGIKVNTIGSAAAIQAYSDQAKATNAETIATVEGYIQQVKDIQDEVESTAATGMIPKGAWNPVTNIPAITATPNPAWADGSFLEITPGPGTMTFAGNNFDIGQAVKSGDYLKKFGSLWTWVEGVDLSKLCDQIRVVRPVTAEIGGFGANGGNPFPLSAKQINVPNTTSGNGTGLTFNLAKPSAYQTGDILYVEIILDENTANITNYSGQILTFNLNVKRNTSGTITTVNNAATSTALQRLSPTQVLLSLKYTITANDTEFTYVIQKPTGGVTNNSGGGWIWTVKQLNDYLTKSTEKLSPISAELNSMSNRVDKTNYDLQNSNLSYVQNNLTPLGSSSSGATYSGNKLTIPVGQHGNGANIGAAFVFEDSPYKLEMIGKTVTFEYIYKTSPNLLNTKVLLMRNFVYVSGGAGGITSGLTKNEQLILIDSTHIKVKFDCLILSTYTDIRPYVQINDVAAVTGSAATIEALDAIFYYWTTTDQKNLNTDVLSHTLSAFKDDVLSNFDTDRSVWFGEHIVWSGTSIPESHKPNSYPEIIGRKLGAIMHNTAIGGSRITFDGSTAGLSATIAELTAINPSLAFQSYENTIMQYLAAPYNSRLVVIDFTANDIGTFPGTLGNINSTAKNTFYGSYDFIIKQILTNYPDTRIVLVTCPNRYFDDISKQEAARTAIKAIGDKWGFPVLDLGGVMGINTMTVVTGQMTYDGVHPTAATAVRIGNVGYRFLLGVN